MDLEEQLVDQCQNGNLDEIKKLVDQGADVHTEDDLPLIEAAEYGHLDIVKFLVENGADIHSDNDAPLRWATVNNHYKVVSYLLTKYPTHEKQSLIKELNLNNLISKLWIQYNGS